MSDQGLGTFVAPKGAAGAVIERQRTLNSRTIPPELPTVKELSEKTQVYIFNVGPWAHTQFMGSLGRFIIPACEEGKAYSKALIIPGIVSELYPETERSMKREMSDGYEVALQIIGVGAHMAPSNALTRYGVAVSRQWPPTKEEIATAFEALRKGELEALIREANTAMATGPQALEQVMGNSDRHYIAARLLKKTTAECPWLARTAVSNSQNIDCKFCGEPMKPNLAKCPNCKEIVNQALYEKLTAKV